MIINSLWLIICFPDPYPGAQNEMDPYESGSATLQKSVEVQAPPIVYVYY